MKIILPVIIFSLFLESVLTNFISLNSYFFIPLLSITSLVLIYPYFNNDDTKYLKYCAILGLAYDLIFTDTLILNMVIFLVVGIIIKLINSFISNNPLNVALITIVAIISYRAISYLILVIVDHINFNFYILFKGIYSSLLLNIIFGVTIYLITDYISKKYKIPKID